MSRARRSGKSEGFVPGKYDREGWGMVAIFIPGLFLLAWILKGS